MSQTPLLARGVSAEAQLASINAAFPKRRMQILTTGKQGLLSLIGFSMVGLALLIGALYMALPDFLYDYKVSRDPVVDESAQIHGSCKTRKAIFIDCDVQIRYLPTPQDTVAKEIKHSFMFVSFQPSLSTVAVRSRSDPSMITTSIATEHITNRFFMILTFSALFAFIFFGCLYGAWKSFLLKNLIKNKPGLQAVMVKVNDIQNERTVSFETEIDGKKKKLQHILRKKEEPLFLPRQEDLALAVRLTGTPHVILLNDELTTIDFTEQERSALKAAIAA
ncbi:hypothetical protein [Undibacterium pigrum]|uniref:Uncharacterized protein n=1 Tax=Undibacterium pigrum TaxID=401470 RepID=A0A318JBR9_9BURK|nr:hypothetical protein [Undibacterium pigrum]PXX45036.1 hypothetical protein DFR42_102248 [Undibacterium pigrum]